VAIGRGSSEILWLIKKTSRLLKQKAFGTNVPGGLNRQTGLIVKSVSRGRHIPTPDQRVIPPDRPGSAIESQ